MVPPPYYFISYNNSTGKVKFTGPFNNLEEALERQSRFTPIWTNISIWRSVFPTIDKCKSSGSVVWIEGEGFVD